MSARAVFFSQRRGACPGLSAPMQTGDGLLVRLLPIGAVPLAAFAALCAAARQHGNGVVEITARGSIQVRGLSADSAPRFADAIAALNIATDGIPVLTNPLAGLDPDEILDAATLAANVRRALATTALVTQLAPKVSVAVDGNGRLTLDALAADVRLRGEILTGEVVVRVAVGGDNTTAPQLGFIAPASAAEAAMRLLKVIAHHGRAARARDVLVTTGVTPFRAAIEDLLLTSARSHKSSNIELDFRLRRDERTIDVIGAHCLRDSSLARGVGLAFGHADATALERLVEVAGTAGATGIQAAPGRALIAVGLTQRAVTPFVAAAEKLGFIAHAGDPRRHVFACAGAPICSSAHIAARAMAPRIAGSAAPHLSASFQIHISGCAKGCAHPDAAALTIVGGSCGCELVANGSARDVPFTTVAAEDLPAAIKQCTAARASEVGHV